MQNKKIKNIIFKLTNHEIERINKEKKKYENVYAVSIEALKIVQKTRGWISDNAIFAIAKLLNISNSDLEGISTFYNQIFRKPVGQYVIRYCDSFVCYINGYKYIQKKIEKILNIKPGETTLNKKFTLLPTCCLGSCDQSPVIMINNDIHISLKTNMISSLLEKYK